MNRSRSAWSLVIASIFVSTAIASDARELSPDPSGEDTEQLQAALSKCAQEHKACNIRLGPGVFHTDVLLVSGFSGSITGRGERRTVIRPIVSRPLRSTRTPFFAEPSLAQPYPVLIHFANGGKVTLSGFTVDLPAAMTVTPYNYYLLGPDGLDITNFLVAAIMMEGDRNAELRMTHVTIAGTNNDSLPGSNLWSAVRFQGEQRFSGEIDNFTDITRKLQRGRFTAHDNKIIRSGSGLWLEDANGTNAVLSGNQIDVQVYGIIMTNLGNSRAHTLGNRVHARSDGIIIFQTRERPPSDPSDYVIALNRISVEGEAFDGIAMVDDAALFDGLIGTIAADVDIWGNDITLLGADVTDGMEIFADGPGDVRIFGNRIRGTPTDSGIWVEFSEGTFVGGNDLRGLNAPQGDVSLRPTSSQCRVIEPGDTVLDLGTDNQVVGTLITPPDEEAAMMGIAELAAAAPRLRGRLGFSRAP